MIDHFISDLGDWKRKVLLKKKKITGEGIQIFTLKNPVAELCIDIS